MVVLAGSSVAWQTHTRPVGENAVEVRPAPTPEETPPEEKKAPLRLVEPTPKGELNKEEFNKKVDEAVAKVAEKKAAKKEVTKPEPAKAEPAKTLDYQKDIVPSLLAALDVKGKDAIKAWMQENWKVTNGSQLPVASYEKFLASLNAWIAE
tara:strand:+ start:3315 stop:3767 length:453 start_codon:yes stop_codon:yes gene_type:complete